MNNRLLPFLACVVALTIGIATDGPLRADDHPDVAARAATGIATPEVTTIKLVLTPAAEPVPALRYRLLPTLLDLHRGNAAVHYNKAALLANSKAMDEIQEKLAAWQVLSADKLPLEEMGTALGQWHTLLEQLEMAARRDACDWELPIREQNAFAILLPELQEIRKYARLLACKARLEIAAGRFTDAIRTLQTGFALARHAAAGPTLINGLVGIAIATQMMTPLNDWAQKPGSPNLYWALTALPQPLVDLRPAMETESAMLYLSYPMLRDLETHVYTTAEWQAFMSRVKHDFDLMGISGHLTSELAFTALVVKSYPGAKRRLLAQGFESKKLDSWPVMQVVVLDAMQSYNASRDRMFRWFYVPYADAAAGMQSADRDLKDEVAKNEGLQLAGLLLPAVNSAYFATVRLERQLAALRVIEAIRLYGMQNHGLLPAKLLDITKVPLPTDPATGEPFDYRLQGQAATLSSTRLAQPSPNDPGLRYELRFTAPPSTNKE